MVSFAAMTTRLDLLMGPLLLFGDDDATSKSADAASLAARIALKMSSRLRAGLRIPPAPAASTPCDE